MTSASTPFSTEAELASVVRTFQEAKGWDVFAEVQAAQGDKRADLVCRDGRRIMVIETKLSLSIEVVSQAVRWLDRAHYVVIAVPKPKNTETQRLAFITDYLSQKGIGLWWVSKPRLAHTDAQIAKDEEPYVSRWKLNCIDREIEELIQVVTQEKLHRYADFRAQEISDVLINAMKSAVAGARTGGDASTPFKRTCLKLRSYVEKSPGIAFKEAIRQIAHHYSNQGSATSAITLLIEKSGLELRNGGLYVKGQSYPEPSETLPAPATLPEKPARKSKIVVYVECNTCHGLRLMSLFNWQHEADRLIKEAQEKPGVTVKYANTHYHPHPVMCGCYR